MAGQTNGILPNFTGFCSILRPLSTYPLNSLIGLRQAKRWAAGFDSQLKCTYFGFKAVDAVALIGVLRNVRKHDVEDALDGVQVVDDLLYLGLHLEDARPPQQLAVNTCLARS